MEHNVTLITTLAAGFGLALLFGFIAERLRLPALVGYLFAGICIGPATPGYVADMGIAQQLSEIGVMLLMFGVGLHFSLSDLLSVRRIAIPGAIVQMAVATLMGAGLAAWWGWQLGAALIFGISLSCASTVVLLRALEGRKLLNTMNGRIAVGWLVMEDLATVLALVLLPPLAATLGAGEPESNGAIWLALGKTLLQVSGFIALMLLVGRRLLPWLIWQVASTGSRELFTLAIIAAAISIACGAAILFGVSFALGAFFAGMVLRESEYSHRAAEESLPLRDAFAVLFFVSVGMLFDPAILAAQPWRVLGVVLIIIVGKTLAAMAIVILLCYPLNSALIVAASLAQIGEFSFILAGLGISLGLLPEEGRHLILAGALFSIALNPFVFSAIQPLLKHMLKRYGWARALEHRTDPFASLPEQTGVDYLQGQVVLVGYGRVGRRIATILEEKNLPYVVVEQNREAVETLRAQGSVAAVAGDAADPEVLVQAHIARAEMLVLAAPDSTKARRIASIARRINPAIELVFRTHSEEESQMLAKEYHEASKIFFGEEELARGMSAHILHRRSRSL